jgi:CRP/FNR family transcriptional regulator
MLSDKDALRNTEIFRELPEELLSRLASLVQHRSYDRGETVFAEGGPGNSLFIVESGEVRIVKEVTDGQALTLAVHGPGRMFGELALLDGKPRSATAIAVNPTKCIVVYRDEFLNLLESEPQALRAVLASLSGMIRETNARLTDVIGLDSNAQMAKTLTELMDKYGKPTAEGVLIDKAVTVDDLASLTGIHPRVVAALLREYQYEDLLLVVGDSITVRRPDSFRLWLADRA